MSVKEWEYYNRLPPEDQERYLLMKRSNRLYDVGDELRGVTQTTGEVTTSVPKGLPPQDTPEVRGLQAAAVEQGKLQGEQRGQIPGKLGAIEAIEKARSKLSGGIYAGAWGPLVKGAVKWTPGMDKTKAARTEEFIAEIGNVVIPRLVEFGGNDSNEELKYLQRVMGGDIQMEPQALDNILLSAEDKITAGIARAREGQAPSGRSTPGVDMSQARRSQIDGKMYVPDPGNPGKYLLVGE